MKKTLFSVALTTLLFMTVETSAAPLPPGSGAYRSGHHGHPAWRAGWHGGYRGPRVGIYYGPGFGYWGAWNYRWGLAYGIPYPYPYPYAAVYPFAYAPVVINSTPIEQTYIQREPVAAEAVQAAPSVSYWYYCTQPAGYFPYGQNCNQPWMKVIPQNPANQK